MDRLKTGLPPFGARFGRHGSVLMSALLIGAIAYELSRLGLPGELTRVPTSPGFWLAFTFYFWGSPFIEWLIVRRLWQAPWSGFGAVLRKMIYNELVLSYLGDAYFFAWIRRELPHVAAPFAVVKDMAIISALMGSLGTLVAIAIVWPLFPAFDRTGLGSPLVLCLAVALASGGAIAFFRKSLLSLSRPEILWIAGAFGVRIVGQSLCAVFMWWSLLPQVPLTTWIVLTAVRMVSARLPLVPSKDLAFAAAAVALVGPHTPVAPMIVLVTTLILLANVALAILLSLDGWARGLAKGREAAA
ncbi:hypothetical protein [Sphingobium nicotianae]|uniref:Uncharacterized protein n=1 Tax=Sphingobium nicotianae TaxID=2782607 RepID=A0A9X1IQT3_9SPHN|nr:hypothetical protein [Sphingobium nicotianae]MBT2186958.1 hypothetical protein [Sphingobium nicotianae]